MEKIQDKVRKRSIKDKGVQVVYTHQSDNSFCKIDQVSEDKMKAFHDKYWSLKDATKERMFIQRYITVSSISRWTNKLGEEVAQRQRSCSITFKVPTKSGHVTVCKETFMGILRENRRKVEKAAKDIITKPDEEMKETRGSARFSEVKMPCSMR